MLLLPHARVGEGSITANRVPATAVCSQPQAEILIPGLECHIGHERSVIKFSNSRHSHLGIAQIKRPCFTGPRLSVLRD